MTDAAPCGNDDVGAADITAPSAREEGGGRVTSRRSDQLHVDDAFTRVFQSGERASHSQVFAPGGWLPNGAASHTWR
jgi:hypothetical protein